MPLEIACFNIASAVLALSAGVDRIELCTNGSVGGLTPSIDELVYLTKDCRSQSDQYIPINIMIRPRGGDFVYTDTEFETMKTSLTDFYDFGADGFVFGMLTPQGQVDEARCRELVALAKGRPCTFHRAFDEIHDKMEALEAVVRCGFGSLLTSGGKDAVEGKNVLRELVVAARGRIEVMPGGGVRSENLEALMNEIKAAWWHSSAIIDGENCADIEEIRQLKRLVDGGVVP